MTPTLIEEAILLCLLVLFLVIVLDVRHRIVRMERGLNEPIPLPDEKPEMFAPAPLPGLPAPPPTPPPAPARPPRPTIVRDLIFMDRDLKVEFGREPWNRVGLPFSDETRTSSFIRFGSYFHVTGQDENGNWIYRQAEDA